MNPETRSRSFSNFFRSVTTKVNHVLKEHTLTPESPITSKETSFMAVFIADAYTKQDNENVFSLGNFLTIVGPLCQSLPSREEEEIYINQYEKMKRGIVRKFMRATTDRQENEEARVLVNWIRNNVKNFPEFYKLALVPTNNINDQDNEEYQRMIDPRKEFKRVLENTVAKFYKLYPLNAATSTPVESIEMPGVYHERPSLQGIHQEQITAAQQIPDEKQIEGEKPVKKKRPQVEEDREMLEPLKFIVEHFYDDSVTGGEEGLKEIYKSLAERGIILRGDYCSIALAYYLDIYYRHNGVDLNEEQMASARKTIKRLWEEEKAKKNQRIKRETQTEEQVIYLN